MTSSQEGGDDVKSSCPLRLGLHTYYNGMNRGKRNREVERIPKSISLRLGLHTYYNGMNRGKRNREVERIPKSISQFGL